MTNFIDAESEVINVQNGVYVPLKLDRQKTERVRKLYRLARPEQALEQVFDDMLYMDKMTRLMKKYKGKVNFKKIYD